MNRPTMARASLQGRARGGGEALEVQRGPASHDGHHIAGRWHWVLAQISNRVWMRALLFSLAAVGVDVVAALVGRHIPVPGVIKLATGSVEDILDVLASSMLAVTTFSLSIMVSAFSSASTEVTPRATRLLITDSIATNTLSTFIGSFLFAIVGIIGLSANVYDENGRLVLFAATLVVVAMVTVALLRWIEELGYLGRVGDTIQRVEEAAVRAARNWGELPRLGAGLGGCPDTGLGAICLPVLGQVRFVDMGRLQRLAEAHDTQIYLQHLPGTLVYPHQAVAYTEADKLDALHAEAVQCFAIGDERDFTQDPRYGLVVLSEIASRALSPGINDPGTAIRVLDGGVNVMLALDAGFQNQRSTKFDRLFAPDIDLSEMLEEFFNPIARDGAGVLEVQTRIQASLCAIAATNPERYGTIAQEQGRSALAHAAGTGMTKHEQSRLQNHTAWLQEHSSEFVSVQSPADTQHGPAEPEGGRTG